MDANESTNPLAAQESDQPMSVDLMRHLLDERHTSIRELRVIFGLSEAAAYGYQQSTALKWDQGVSLFHSAEQDGVREALLKDLMRGGRGYQVINLPESMDFNGDGDVNDRDVIQKTNESIAHAAIAIGTLIKVEKPENVDAWCEEAQAELGRVIAAATAASAAVDHIQAHATRPKQTHPRLVGVGKAVRRG